MSYPGLHAASFLFFIAIVLIFVGMILIMADNAWKVGSVNGGAVLIIGPIPIILGSGPYSLPLVVLSIVLTVFAIVLFIRARR